MPAPGFYSQSLADVPFLLTAEGKKAGGDVLLASGQTSSLTPTSRIPPGTVVVKKTGDGKYYFADDATDGDRNTAASVSSVEAGDTGWVSAVITCVIDGRTIEVTLGGADDTTAEIVTALNGNAIFAAHLVASGTNGNPLVITSLQKGAQVSLSVSSDIDASTDTGFGAAGVSDNGADADYRVTDRFGHLVDLDGTAVDDLVGTLWAGHFKRTLLSNLTAEAEAVLLRRGSRIE